MKRYRAKPVIIEAKLWLKHGDHECVMNTLHEGEECSICGRDMSKHGVIATLEGVMTICPGDYLIKGTRGEYYACKPDVFKVKYEAI